MYVKQFLASHRPRQAELTLHHCRRRRRHHFLYHNYHRCCHGDALNEPVPATASEMEMGQWVMGHER